MESILIILSWAILLVPGFDHSDPPTGDKIFKIEFSDNVQTIKTTSDATLDFWGFKIGLEQNSTGILDIKIPRNFPIPASYTNSWSHGEKPVVVGDKKEIAYEMVLEPCYFHYKIPVKGEKNVEIAYAVILAGKAQLHSSVQFNENDPCYNKVFYKPAIESPLKQFKSGVPAEQVKCKEDLYLIFKSTNEQPACVKRQTALKLIERKWASESLIQKTWVEIDPIQCGANTWEQDWIKSHPDDNFVYARVTSKEKIDIITNYYKKLGITIFDAKLMPWENTGVCGSCSCPAGYTQSLLVSNSDVDNMLESGYRISGTFR